MNLTKIEGTYSKEIYDLMPRLKDICTKSNLSLHYMKNCVRIIVSRTPETEARTRFLGYLDGCTSKDEVLALCNNTIQKAMKYNPTKKAS